MYIYIYILYIYIYIYIIKIILYIKMVKNIIRSTRKNFKKKHVKYIKIFLQKKKKKSVSIIVNVIRIFLKKKKKRVLSIWQVIIWQIENSYLCIYGVLRWSKNSKKIFYSEKISRSIQNLSEFPKHLID